MILASGCSSKKETTPVPRDPSLAISCVGVLPVQITNAEQNSISFSGAKQVQEGAFILNNIIRNELSGKKEFRFVSQSQLSSVQTSQGSSGMQQLKAVAEQLSCNAMLEVKIERYFDRVGGEYTAKSPASVAFQYRLYEMSQGRVLCHGRFDEVQQSFMENLYNWKRASNRGLKWITAEQLLGEGVKEKFSECSYLSDSEE